MNVQFQNFENILSKSPTAAHSYKRAHDTGAEQLSVTSQTRTLTKTRCEARSLLADSYFVLAQKGEMIK